MRQVKRILAILLAVCFVISSTQISSYAQIDSGEDTLETVDTEDASDDAADEDGEDTSEFTDEIDGEVSVSAASDESASEEDETDMPAVTLTADTDNGISVTVDAPEGAFPSGVVMTVETLTGDDAEEFLNAVDEQDFSLYDETYTVIDSAIVEISFYVDGEKVQPETEVTVTIGGLDLATEDEDGLTADYALVYHMSDEGAVEWIEDEEGQEPGLSSYTFTASEFSAYGVVNVDVEYGVSAATVDTEASINFSKWTSWKFEHCDIKYVVMNSASSGYTLNDVTEVVIKDSDGDTKYTSSSIPYASATSNYQCHFNDSHSIALYGSYTVEITFELKDSDGNITTLTATFDSSSVYAEGTYYPTSASNASKLYNYLYGTSTIPSNVTQIDVSGMSVFLVAAILCDSSSVTGLGTVTGNTQNWGLDFAIDISTLLTYSTSYTPTISKTFDADIAEDAFSFTLYNASVSGSTWITGSKIETQTSTVASATDGIATESISFTPQSYTSDGTYYYIVKENTGSDSSITYDSSVYGIAVTVSGTTVSAVYYSLTPNNEEGSYTQGDTVTTIEFENSSTTEFTATKTWEDDDDVYGNRPEEITLQLYKGSVEYGNAVTVKEDNGDWTYTWTDLPKTDSDGDDYIYSVVETSVGGYTTSYVYTYSYTDSDGDTQTDTVADLSDITVADYTVTSVEITNTLDTTSATVEKNWDDNSNALYLRPNSITATLHYTYTDSEGEQTGTLYSYTDNEGSTVYTTSATNATAVTATLTGDSWDSYTWTDLPTYINGYAVTYSVVESDVEYYTAGYATTKDDNGNTTVTITNTINVGVLSITKSVIDPDGYATSNTFTFTVSGLDSSLSSVIVEITDGTTTTSKTVDVDNGTVTFDLTGGQTATIKYLPTGSSYTATYTVTESETTSPSWNTLITYDGTESESKSAEVSVTAGETTEVTYTNTIAGSASIAITKDWSDYSNTYSTRPDNDGTSFAVTLTPVIETTVDETTIYSLDTDNSISTTGIWTVGSDSDIWTITLNDVPVYDSDGNAITYAITETELEFYTLTADAPSTMEIGGVTYYIITPATSTAVELTNELDTASVTVTKTVVDEDGNKVEDNTDKFRIALYAYTRTYDESSEEYVYTAAYNNDGSRIIFETTLTSGGSITYDNIPLGYYWSVSEWVPDNNKTAYTADFTVSGASIVGGNTYRWYYDTSNLWINTYRYIYIDSADTAISIDIKNTQQEVSINPTSDFPAATKTLTGNGDEETEYIFRFIMRDNNLKVVATGTATVKMDGTPVSVAWDYSDEDALTYTSTGTYVYTIVESQYYDDSYSTYAGVDYTDTTYTMVVTVTIDDSGNLVASTAIYENYGEDDQAEVDSADFENTYDADDATYTLVGLKSLEGRTITANEFTISIQEYTDEDFATPNGEPVTTGTEANGRFDYTFTFDEVGNYYFTVTEAAGSETGMTYDTDTTYYLWFAVYNTVDENTGDAVLGVSFRYKTSLNAEWSNDYTPLESITFANTYKADGSTVLQVRKYMTGRTFNEDDVFTFRVTAVNGAPLLEIDSNGKAYTVSDGTDADGNECKVYTGTDDSVYYVYTDSDGNSYILITVTGTQLLETAGSDSTGYYATVDLLTLYYTQDDISSVYTYRVTEEQGSANGVSYDVDNYGHAVDVTVSDAGNGVLSVTKSNTAGIEGTNGEAIVVNTFSQGNVNIYGTKVWVDGGASHDNIAEVELTLYYSTDGGTTWTAWTSNGDGTWSIEGSGSYTLSWGTYNTNNWRILDLPQYSFAGADMIYKVVETSIGGYVTTYDTTDDDASDAEAVPSDNSSTNRYTITNTIEQEYLTLSGTKTWVDGGLTHNNSTDVTLVVTRSSTSAGTETLEEETDYTVSWNGNTYTITGIGNGLPKYDDAGYVYTYTVTESTTNGQITVTIDGVEYTYDVSYDGYDITNTREEEKSTSDKTEAGTAVKDGTTSEGTAYAAYSEVSVGDEITYIISYYNGNNTSAVITIEDILDNGVTWVSATNPKTWTDTASDSYSISGQSEGTDSNGIAYKYGGTVTWSFTADAFESGTVTLTVQVNENAKTAGDALSDDWNDTATVDNQATVTIADNKIVTDIVTNPLEDDDPTAPTKSVEIYDGDEDGDADYDDDDESVSVGDTVTYRISYYNNLAATATVTITDVLDDGVTYGSSTDEGTYDSDTHTVSWELTVAPFTGGYVYVTVTVNDNAKLSENTYDVKGAGTLDYGVNEENTTASIADEASVTVGNQDSQYTDVVENPLDSDEPQEPAKTISANSPDGYTTSTETVEGEDGAADTVTYNNSVGVGSTIEYVISYYNNNNYKTTVTITDDLDDGVTFVSASDGGKVSGQSGDESTFYYGGTVTWTLEIEPLTEVTVYLEVLVNENARITEDGEDTATVDNQATVTDGEVSNDTNIVVNPVDPDEPGDPDKVVSAASEAGIDGANVSEGDQITYTISFYNHNNSSADVTIVDELDDGVDFISASFDGTTLTYDEDNNVSTVTSSDGDVTIAYDKDSHTVTWTIKNVSAFTGGEVDLTVKVNSSAIIQVANDAEVTVGDNKQTTDVVTNPVDDDPEDPVKTESDHRIVDTDEDGTITYDDVAVDEEITYTISYYNYYGTPATITIEDKLDDGVEYIDSSDDGVYDADTHMVTWTLENVEAYEHGTVTLIVRVTETAKETVSDETEATVENQATVTVGDDGGNTTNLVINPLEDDDPQDPEKTESGYGEGTEVEEEDGNVIYYDKVSVGDEITYTISYYNHYAESATITIEDVLDEGVDYVENSASDGGAYDEETRTLTWILENVAPFTEGSVTFTVTVNEKAMTYTEGETDADGNAAAVIENQATVTVGDVDNTTNIVTNPLEDDEAEEPEKTESSITDAETGETYEPTEQTTVEDEDGTATVTYNGVNVGDEITYSISYYNYQNKTVDVTITDALDEGVDFVSATDENGNLVTSGYDLEAHTYTWYIEDVSPLTTVTVTLTVCVNANAKLTDTADETASVENQATVTVDGVDNRTDIVVNELEEGEEENPVKTISENSPSGYTDEPAIVEGEEDAADTLIYDSVGVSGLIEYVISYYNHYNTATTITITDELDAGVDFVSASGVDEASEEYDPNTTEADYVSYTYDETTHTVTWTIKNATALTEGSVVLIIQVNEDAKDTDDSEDTATVENQATVTVGEVTNDTDIVVNPINPDDPDEPEKVVSAESEAGVDGVNVAVGDQITYTISYYNHTNSSSVITIEDELDAGVDFVSAGCNGVTLVYDKDGGVYSTEDSNVTISYDEEAHTVTWTIENVSAFTGGTVDLTVEVNSEAVTQLKVENDADVTVGDNTYTTNLVTNPVDDEPTEPEKTVNVGDGTEVSVGDRLVYTISYYNNLGTAADITIVDVLDEGVTYVSSSDGGVYDADTHTVTWTLSNVKAYKHGEVRLTVTVNENARTAGYGETASVVNDADVTVGNQAKQTTNMVENPLEPDEPTEPGKEVSERSEAGVDGANVSQGDQITYTISYYNNTNSAALVTIEDALDEGVDFVSATCGDVTLVYDKDSGVTGTDVGDVTISYDEETHTVTWLIRNVSAFTEGTVDLTVEVNSEAVTQVENDADVTIGNNDTQTTDKVTNPVDDEPEDPVKTEISITDAETGETDSDLNATVNGEMLTDDTAITEETTITYDEVAVGDEITYTISYYNHYGTPSTITIEDELDPGAEFVSAGGTYTQVNEGIWRVTESEADAEVTVSESGTRVTWTLTNVKAYERGTVTLTVRVTETAMETASDETEATVENQATVTVGDVENDTNYVVNPLEDDEHEESKEVEVYDNNEDGSVDFADDGDTVYAGQTVTYKINYYNNTGSTADITITDTLDDGVDYVENSASDGGIYDEETRTITWAMEDVVAFTEGSVTFSVTVNENAMIYEDGETDTNGDAAAVIENQATVTVGDVDNTTNIVINPLEDDEAEEPEKTESAITDAETGETYEPTEQSSVENEDGTATVTYNSVNVGDEITYSISYYNNQNKAVDVVISDALDEGVDFVSATDENGDLVTSGYDSEEHTYTWNISDVSPLTTVTVTLTVRVNDNAKLTESADETASVENQATVTVGDVENQTDIVVNELNEGEEENPSKVISENSPSGYTDDPETAVDSDGNTVVTYDSVSTGSMIEYVISYYNHYNTATTVTIEDALDEGVDFISASGADAASEDYDPDSMEANYISYIYDETTHTVTWTITNAAALTEGSVTLVVQVNENAKNTDDGEDTATVENQATVTIGDVENDTEIVVNPIDPDEPSDPEKVVSAASEAGVDGANVSAGDRITYTISYYNHTNSSAVVTIEDALDEGVDFVSASCGGVTLVYDDSDTVTDGNVTISYNEKNHSVTWTIDNVSAFTGGTVDLTVEVNSDAAAETQVVNEADVTVGDNKATTNLVSNPVDDEPETPVKSVNVGDGTEVSAGDRLVYTISYYNNLGTAADITIVDVLDEGVTYISSSDGGVYDADTHTVTWNLSNVNAYKHGEVTVTVNVNENARTAASGEIASVVNDADVTVGNQAKQTTNLVENPLEPDEPVNPTKSVDVGDGTEVSAGDTLVYTITYYNHLNTSATVTITDTLEEGLTFVSASDGGTYDEDTRTVTWTLEDVSAFTEGTVTLKVEVNSDIDSSADNTAEVSIGGASAVSTNTVTNPVKETSETTIVKTGDNSRFLLWLILLIASAAGMCTLGVYEQKRRRFGRVK